MSQGLLMNYKGSGRCYVLCIDKEREGGKVDVYTRK